MEQCQRCLELGEDRRTLWMACFYAMNELKVPFTQHNIPMPDNNMRQFFTLRVCKQCRASWLKAIEDWFNKLIPGLPTEPTAEAIFPVRIRGGIYYMTSKQFEVYRDLGDLPKGADDV